MAIAKEDIKEGWYWLRSRDTGVLSVVQVGTLGEKLVVMHSRWTASLDDVATDDFDFVARIEPPEGV
jgi:hypothetical protein